MYNLQYVNVPFVSAYDIFKYVDGVGLSISPTGQYLLLQSASDNWLKYTSGNISFVSGYGYWQGSGFSAKSFTYFFDDYQSYFSGNYSGNSLGIFLQSGSLVNGYVVSFPINYTGNGKLNLLYSFDDYESYTTGAYTGTVNLNNGNVVSGYLSFIVNYSGKESLNLLYSFDDYESYGTGWSVSPILINGNNITGYYNIFPSFYNGSSNFTSGYILDSGTSGFSGNCHWAYNGVQHTISGGYFTTPQSIAFLTPSTGGFNFFPTGDFTAQIKIEFTGYTGSGVSLGSNIYGYDFDLHSGFGLIFHSGISGYAPVLYVANQPYTGTYITWGANTITTVRSGNSIYIYNNGSNILTQNGITPSPLSCNILLPSLGNTLNHNLYTNLTVLTGWINYFQLWNYAVPPSQIAGTMPTPNLLSIIL